MCFKKMFNLPLHKKLHTYLLLREYVRRNSSRNEWVSKNNGFIVIASKGNLFSAGGDSTYLKILIFVKLTTNEDEFISRNFQKLIRSIAISRSSVSTTTQEGGNKNFKKNLTILFGLAMTQIIPCFRRFSIF